MIETVATNSTFRPQAHDRWHVEQGLDGLLRGTLAAVCLGILQLPTLIRAGVAIVPGLIAVSGTAALTLGPLVALRRSAGAWPAGTRSLLVGLLAGLPILALLGSVLFSGTHHRPLGAVTFAVLAVIVSGAAVIIASRLTDPARQLLAAPWAARFDRALGFVWFGIVGGFVVQRALRSPDAALVFSAGWQLAAAVFAFVAASLSPWPRKTTSAVRTLGAFLWALLVAASLLLLHVERESATHGSAATGFASAVLHAAPILAWPWAGYR